MGANWSVARPGRVRRALTPGEEAAVGADDERPAGEHDLPQTEEAGRDRQPRLPGQRLAGSRVEHCDAGARPAVDRRERSDQRDLAAVCRRLRRSCLRGSSAGTRGRQRRSASGARSAGRRRRRRCGRRGRPRATRRGRRDRRAVLAPSVTKAGSSLPSDVRNARTSAAAGAPEAASDAPSARAATARRIPLHAVLGLRARVALHRLSLELRDLAREPGGIVDAGELEVEVVARRGVEVDEADA